MDDDIKGRQHFLRPCIFSLFFLNLIFMASIRSRPPDPTIVYGVFLTKV